jgi:hypothetical protein
VGLNIIIKIEDKTLGRKMSYLLFFDIQIEKNIV